MSEKLSTASRVPELAITDGILYSISTIFVGLRLYTRARVVRKTGSGDWWMLAAWVSSLTILYNYRRRGLLTAFSV